MAAADHLSPHQLAMFMTPREIVGSGVTFGDQRKGESVDGLMARKQQSNVAHGVTRTPVTDPVVIDHVSRDFGLPSMFSDGHHRLAAAYHRNPDEHIPVEHMDQRNWETTSSNKWLHEGDD